MKYVLVLFAALAAASFAQAAPCQCGPGCDCGPLACDCFSASAPMTYAECQAHCIAHNQPMPVAVGKCEYTGDMVRANWLADCGYPNNAVLWFAPDGGKMFYSGTTKPALVNGSYFPAAIVPAAAGGCASGNCPTSAPRGFFRR